MLFMQAAGSDQVSVRIPGNEVENRIVDATGKRSSETWFSIEEICNGEWSIGGTVSLTGRTVLAI